MNNCQGDDLVKERLDRVLCDLNWRLAFPEAEVYALPFVFEAYWLQDQACRNIIEHTWTSAKQVAQDLVWTL